MVSCHQSPELNGVNLTTWKSDVNGCKGERLELAEKLLAQQAKLEGLTPTEIGKLFGKPDQIALYKRSQRFYVYYLTPSSGCPETNDISQWKSLHIRFSALDRLNELFIQEEFAEDKEL